MTPTEPLSQAEPKDETLSIGGSVIQLLDRLEVLVGKLGMNSPEQSQEFLKGLDEVQEKILQLEGKISRKTADGQFEGILVKLRKGARRFVKDVGGAAALKSLREESKPPVENWWWYLDELLEKARRASLRRGGFGLLGIVLGLVIMVVIYNLFLAPDPATMARYQSEQKTRDELAQGNLSEALAQAEKGLQSAPSDPVLLILKGVILEEQGNTEQAQQVMVDAEKYAKSREDFLYSRGQAYLLSGGLDKAASDVDLIIRLNPESAQAYMLSGQINEQKKEYSRAFDDYGRAYDLADAHNQSQLAATARVHMADMLQYMVNTAQPTLTPVP